MDEAMYYHYILLSASEWKTAGGMDSATSGRPTGMSPSVPFVHLGGGYVSVLHNKTMLTGFLLRVPGGRLP